MKNVPVKNKNLKSAMKVKKMRKSQDNSTMTTSKSIMDTHKPIKVYARVRPLNEDEIARDEKCAVETFDDGKRLKMKDERLLQETTFHFDGVFDGKDSNTKVYEGTTQELLNNFLNGINCAILTYGQTGSGKTYTLLADGCVAECTMKELFQKINEDELHDYQICCSFVQIYLEKAYDLLNGNNNAGLKLREHPQSGIYITNLTHKKVETVEEIFEILRQGKDELITAETNMVRQSSRSHSIFQIGIERKLKERIADDTTTTNENDNESECVGISILDEGIILRAKMDICDLAGSERLDKTLVEGVNKDEARCINSSLLQLGNVINALAKNEKVHVPFRNSILTRLLQECLGSKCMTSFIVCVAPSKSEFYETICSLNFGARARMITNKERIKPNAQVDYKLLSRRLSRQIVELKSELKNVSLLAHPHKIRASIGFDGDDESINNDQQGKSPQEKDFRYLVYISEALEFILDTQEENSLETTVKNEEIIRNINNALNIVLKVLKYIQEIIKTDEKEITCTTTSTIQSKEQNKTKVRSTIEEFISEVNGKIRNAQNELSVITTNDINDFLHETIYTLSETYDDIESALLASTNSFMNISTEIQSSGEFTNSLYKVLDSALHQFYRSSKDSTEEIFYTKDLICILQTLQVTRLFMETISSTRRNSNGNKKEKLLLELSSNNIPTNITATPGNSSAESSIIDKDSPIEEELGEIRRPNLFRTQSFKIKNFRPYNYPPPTSNFSDEMSSPEHDRGHIEDTPLNGHHIVNQGELCPLENMVEPNERDECFSCESQELIDEYRNLQGKYDSVMEENQYLYKENYNIQQNHLDLMKKVQESRCEFEILISNENSRSSSCRDHKSALAITDTHIYCGEMSFDNFQHDVSTTVRNNDDAFDEFTFQETHDIIIRLEAENGKLLKEKNNLEMGREELENLLEETIEGCNNLKKENRKLEATKSAIVREMLDLCKVLETVKELEESRRTPLIRDELSLLESDLFVAIEENVRMEAAMSEIRFKLLKHTKLQDSNKPETKDNKQPKKNVKSNCINKSSCRPQFYMIQKLNNVKKIERNRIQNLRRSNADQPGVISKQIKYTRGCKIKALEGEKHGMFEKINNLEEHMKTKDAEIAKLKNHVDLLVKEVGFLDIESMDTGIGLDDSDIASSTPRGSLQRELTYVKDEDKVYLEVSIPTINQETDETDDARQFRYTPDTATNFKRSKNSKRNEYGGKNNNIKASTTLGKKVADTIKELEESNNALKNELESLQMTNTENKEKFEELRNEKVKLLMDVRTKGMNANNVHEMTINKLEKQLRNSKAQVSFLEKQNSRLRIELKRYKDNKTQTRLSHYNSESSDEKLCGSSV